jgi:tripartite-type tricarboxylate transporter receptor subunit TctC
MRGNSPGASDIAHIPYRGMAAATNDLIAGHILFVIRVVSTHCCN